MMSARLDPPVLTSSASMDSIRMSPSPIQNQGRSAQPVVQHHPQTNQQGIEMQYQQTNHYPQQPSNIHQQQIKMHNNVISQPPLKHPMQQLGPRSPLLENHQELYGTKQQTELSRQYALREQMQMAAQRMEQQQQQQSIPLSNSSYSIPSPSQDPILNAVVPPGFNVSVHQAYLRRNQHQFDPQQIYQNHQNVYSPTSPKMFQPYDGRISQANYSPQNHSHTSILRQQYNELQQMKLQQQIQYQTQAQIQQQHTFAQRQILHQHLHSRQQSQQNLNQYGLVSNPMHQDSHLTDSQYLRKNEMSPTDDYAYQQSPINQPVLKQQMSSPNMNYSGNNSNKNEYEISSPSSKSPSGSESRRSSSGTTQALRSPIAQRPLTAPVTMAGWLYKQGSDGLKVWRKRWFVLSEYCLFYYKGQEEDKLLGSVLLPSYQVSVCTPDDKVLRKFAFKCEHTNMRTYILAAPDRDQMNQWVKAVTMAALMQEGCSGNEKFSPSNTDKNKVNNTAKEQDDLTQEIVPGKQPTYENAPPKPRRSNEGYNSPSPDRTNENYDPTYDTSRNVKNHSNNHSNMKVSGTDAIYESKSGIVTSNYAMQRQLTKSPEPVYNPHNLSLPLKNTATNRLENNKSPYSHQDNSSNRIIDISENRISLNKPYVDNRSNYQQDQSPYHYPKEKQNSYPESGYQKMIQQQEYHKNEDMREKYAQDIYQQNMLNHIPIERQAFERRTPDTYGRSAIVPGYYSKGRTGDYEDVYNNQANEQSLVDKYQRPLSPTTYEDRKIVTHYTNRKYEPSNNENFQMYSPSSHIRQKKIPHNYTAPTLPFNTVPRPHSADFLEYESKTHKDDSVISNRYASNASRQPPRPKSSLDINNYDYNGDSYYYSEASYAEKMRQSAHYLRSKASGNSAFVVKRGSIKSPDFVVSQRKMSAPTFRVNDINYDDDARVEREHMYAMRDQNKNVNGRNDYKMSDNSGLSSNWTLKNKSLSHIPLHDDVYNRSNSAMSEGSTASGFNKDQINENGDLFMRSASARLPASEPMTSRDGERKVQQREESMKRLLEWKQRMLQSPLTRKTTPATLSLARSLNQTKSLSQTQGLNDRFTILSGQTFPKTTSKTSNHHPTYNSYSSDDEASVSISGVENRNINHSLSTKKSFTGSNPSLVRTSSRDITIPVRAVSPRVRSSSAQPWNSQNNHDYDTWNNQMSSQNHLIEDNWSTVRSPSRQSTQPIRAVSPRVRRASDVDERSSLQQANANNETLLGISNLTAGELLGRTHEELVLLLIQLRRKHTATANAIDQCCMQIKSVQSRINMSEMLEHKQENLQRLEQLKHHLMELEKHYEKSKPLVHLVDNMVKLGTLYNRGSGSVPSTLDRLEYNQMIRERALMEQAAEQKRWAESSESLPREQIERRVEELRVMERWVAGEAGTLRSLKQERERETMSGPALQQDLSRVHAMLAINSKKLEQTVAGNARLEQELMVLRQKLQQQQQNTNISSSNGELSVDARTAADATALLEDELRRVQQLVGDLQKQRQELSVAVRQLTDKSQSLGLISPTKQTQPYHGESTHNVKDSTSKVRNNLVWLETDLDNNTFVEHGTSGNISNSSSASTKKLTPLYIDTQSNTNYSSENKDVEPSPVVSDELSQNNMFNNLTNVEKQEIKTVRIVKRESERRQRDRERSLQPGNSDWSSQQSGSILDQLVEEDSLSSYQSRSTSLPRGFQSTQSQSSYTFSYPSDSISSKSYLQSESTSSHQYRSQTNPPNTLSLTNVNIPFESMSTSSANSTSKYLSSPSLNNNDYLTNNKDSSSNYYTTKYGYNDHYSTGYNLPKENHSRSIPYLDSPIDSSRPLTNGPVSPGISKNGSVNSLNKGNAELSPVFTSETARQIIIEMAGEKNGFIQNNNGSQHRRQVPKEKRRHYTAPHDVISKTLEKSADDDIFCQEKWWRARDDVDMERVLRSGANGANKHGPPPLVAPPDVVRSTLPTGPLPEHYSEHTIDRLLAAPNKILIPERYVPEQAPELSPEEQKKRKEKVESIKKMLSSTTTPSSDPNKSPDVEDKRQREHLLQLNQILAKQVMEMSKIVAGTGVDNPQSVPSPSSTNQKS